LIYFNLIGAKAPAPALLFLIKRGPKGPRLANGQASPANPWIARIDKLTLSLPIKFSHPALAGRALLTWPRYPTPACGRTSIHLRLREGSNKLGRPALAGVRMFNTRCRAINRIGPHNIDIISIVFGLLLGDGFASNRTGEGVRIAIKQSEVHKEYLFFLYNLFYDRGYCTNLEPRKYTRSIKGIERLYFGYEFNTYTFRSLS